jgi:hypothetical protein
LYRDIVAGAVEVLGLNNIISWPRTGPLGMHYLVHEPHRYQAAILMETFLWQSNSRTISTRSFGLIREATLHLMLCPLR